MKLIDHTKVTGHVLLQLIEGDEVVKEVRGTNIWTNTGRQFLAQLMSKIYVNDLPTGNQREDRIFYIGFGKGSQLEKVNVTELVDPVAFDANGGSNEFLAPITDNNLVTNVNPAYTGMQFERTYANDELVESNGDPITLTEIGLFTDGNQDNDFVVEAFNNTIDQASSSFAPMAYRTFEPLKKTMDYSLRVVWEVRFS